MSTKPIHYMSAEEAQQAQLARAAAHREPIGVKGPDVFYLLEKLEALANIIESNQARIGYEKGSPVDKRVRAARAAITKAEGGAA